MTARSRSHLVRLGCFVVAVVAIATLSRPVLAHAGSLSGSLQPAPVPFWLVIVSGGGVVGVSFLFTSLMTDDETIHVLNARRLSLPSLPDVRRRLTPIVRWLAVGILLAVVGFGLFGPSTATLNLAVLVVWVGWWAGYTMSTYLVADTWGPLNPWRTIATVIPTEPRALPKDTASVVSVVGLLGLVWLEVVSPVAQSPQTLAIAVIAYSVATVGGAVRYGEVWFERADPVARVFRLYGRLAPLQRADSGLSLAAPGAALTREPEPLDDGDVAFVVALLWVTTYDGLVSTAAWNRVVFSVATVGLPPRLVHLVTVVVGFGLLFGAYSLAARLSRRTADSYVSTDYIAGWFAPALVPIAAGYHLAHFLDYFLGLAPVLVTVALDPLSPPSSVPVFVVPSWFGALQLAFVIVGHLLAVWVSHARSFDLFPGRLQPIRSQYPFVVVMVAYTILSLWVVSQPDVGVLT